MQEVLDTSKCTDVHKQVSVYGIFCWWLCKTHYCGGKYIATHNYLWESIGSSHILCFSGRSASISA